jgi:adenine-specific DNA-methyltransferase
MMTPRLKLLRELLTDDGVIFVSIDDNEQYHLRMLMNEVFGQDNFISQIVWKKKTGAGKHISYVFDEHEYVLIFSKTPSAMEEWRLRSSDDGTFRNPDNDERGPWESCAITAPSTNRNPNQLFMIEVHFQKPNANLKSIDKEGRSLVAKFEYIGHTVAIRNVTKKDPVSWEDFDKNTNIARFIRRWAFTKESIHNVFNDLKVYFNGPNLPRFKKFEKEYVGKALRSIYYNEFSTQQGTNDLREIFGDKITEVFEYPKPVLLIKHLITAATKQEDIVLDSFAGSGPAAHAVLALNKEDGGNRRFILVECEDYADKITAERVRRVIKGVPKAKDENLKKGLGSSFSYFDLGPPIEMESILSGDDLPNYKDLARYVFYTATGEEFDEKAVDKKRNFIGESREYLVYLFYKPDIDYLKATALTLDKANALGPYKNKRRLIFAPTKYLDQDHLDQLRIDFAQLPFEIYNLVK